ncbi:hypothetical protein ADICYQ_0570 [Cyclobacterium qasimii M12-11B]|uniref:Uncharacterized protein n=1 Tax=Cyclobacterium qasimii M12-11B TaxID=641524 RepID=S7VLU0_9BACT|nr:hypothetical protein ADICYQ_0570 [Cyclobacterium qasimii M12-11B]
MGNKANNINNMLKPENGCKKATIGLTSLNAAETFRSF